MESRRRCRGKRTQGRPTTKIVTWFDVFADFKKNHPDMKKDAPDFRPYDYATILLYFVDGRRMTYNYDTKKLTLIDD